MPRLAYIKKALIIGSGPIVIGQAAEFDYAGAQACKSLREEGISTVLVNSNPATIMTDEGMADSTYIEPLTVDVLERIIERERPDGILGTLGGQTGLNLAVEISNAGILERYNTKLLGTPAASIQMAESREEFKQLLLRIGEPAPPSKNITSVEEAVAFAEEIGLPLVCRPAYTLGGAGGGVAWTHSELQRIVQGGLDQSPIHQVLLEHYLKGWKELEYEVIRDSAGACITVCNMENIDPLGVHTGDSIVVAPSQTLTDHEYQMLRNSAIKIVRALGVEGGCNVQFALDPHSDRYYVIEVNPRVSRSSALASKATGYPIARVAAKIALGYHLHEIKNSVTGRTSAAFEPALDYVVVKIPRWPFDKFPWADRTLGTQMKATGEVMAIDRTFEAALQKAMRSLEIKIAPNTVKPTAATVRPSDMFVSSGLHAIKEMTINQDDTPFSLTPNDSRLWKIMETLRANPTDAMIEEVHANSGIDRWFLKKLRKIVLFERRLKENSSALSADLLRTAKRMGFSDEAIGALTGKTRIEIRQLRRAANIAPVYKMVDTCAGEFVAQTPYYYSTYETENEAPPLAFPKAIVLGSGPIRIGQGIEFDYCSVRSAMALRDSGVASIMINSNPETVSTDFDMSNRLYFEPLDIESILAVIENESGDDALPPVIVQFGGQTAINAAKHIDDYGAPILGTNYEGIDIAEDRERFEQLMERLQIDRPKGSAVRTHSQALRAAGEIGYPVLVRPSFVLGGRAMEIVHNSKSLRRYVERALSDYGERPLLIDQYLNGIEVEVDAICDGEITLIPGIMRHIERAGVHSGDSYAVYPAVGISEEEIAKIISVTERIALALEIRGLLNIQFVVTKKNPEQSELPNVYVLEVNPRASRTVPFLSKVTGVPMVTLATQAMQGISLKSLGYRSGLYPIQNLFAVKAPVFSMSKIIDAETALGPEMKSTGEVMGIDKTYFAALQKAFLAAGVKIEEHSAALLSIADRDKDEALDIAKTLAKHHFTFYATSGTARWLEQNGIAAQTVNRISDGDDSIPNLIRSHTVSLVINTISGRVDIVSDNIEIQDGFKIRRGATESGVPCFTSLDTARALVSLLNTSGQYSVAPFAEYRQPATAGLAQQ